MNTTNTDSQTRATWFNKKLISVASAAWICLLCCSAAMLLGYLMMPDLNPADQIGYMLRVTARIAFIFLMLAYLASPLNRIAHAVNGLDGVLHFSRMLLRNRRYLGLAMAWAHTVHFAYVVALLVSTDTPLDALTLIFGGLAFVLMWLMAATSNNASVRLLKGNWRRLHIFGLHYLWLVFMQSFVGVVVLEEATGPIYALYLVLVVLGMAGLLLRQGLWLGQRFKRTR